MLFCCSSSRHGGKNSPYWAGSFPATPRFQPDFLRFHFTFRLLCCTISSLQLKMSVSVIKGNSRCENVQHLSHVGYLLIIRGVGDESLGAQIHITHQDLLLPALVCWLLFPKTKTPVGTFLLINYMLPLREKMPRLWLFNICNSMQFTRHDEMHETNMYCHIWIWQLSAVARLKLRKHCQW